VPLLKPLSREQRNRIVDALEQVSYTEGETIITEGELGEHFYMIESGTVDVSSSAHGKLATRTQGDYFGELSLQTGEPTIATVVATGPCKLVRMARAAFIRVLGPLTSSAPSPAAGRRFGGGAVGGAPNGQQAHGRQLTVPGGEPGDGSSPKLGLRQYDVSGREIAEGAGSPGNVDSSKTSAHSGDSRQPSGTKIECANARASYDVSSFLVSVSPIGEGGFGKVRLARDPDNGEQYAIKQMSKAHLIRMGQAEHATEESSVLDSIDCKFIASKVGSFQTDCYLFIVLELAPGGDLYQLLEERTSSGKLAVGDARAFIAQLLLALEYLHARSIVHRDVKLENLLLATDGTLKLTDFGFAKKVEYRTFTLCGTPEYLAPEIILNKGYGRGVDYWAAGIVLYELLAG
jgi:hypothetical protein